MALHFSEATPVDTKTIYQQQGGRGRWGPQDFSVTERRAVRQVIPSNKRGKKTERKRRGGKNVMAVVVKGLTASAEAFEALKPRSVAGTQTRILYSYLCTETLEGLSGAAAGWALCCLWGGDLQRQRKKERVLVWRGHGRVKWQAWGWRKRLELQEKTSSLVTKAAGLRSTVPALSLSLLAGASSCTPILPNLSSFQSLYWKPRRTSCGVKKCFPIKHI